MNGAGMGTGTRLLEVRDLRVSFMTHAGEVQAVRGVSFHLDEGETFAIVGESGCGKSVSILTIMKLNPEPPAEVKGGSILYRGEELLGKTDSEMRSYRGKAFSMMFQDSMTSLNPTMRVGRQLVEAIRMHRKIERGTAREMAVTMLGQVGLPDPRKTYASFPHTLSGGMRQRIMIAMALCCDPGILFADEPTTALDVTMQAQILELMNGIKRDRRTSIVLVTHDLGVVARMADRIAVMYAGQIVETGSAADIFSRPAHPYTWGLMGSMPNLIQERQTELLSIPGTPPDLFAPPPGCAFAPRCGHCLKVCRKAPPPECTVSGGHVCRCWLLDERAANRRPAGRPVPRAARESG